VRKRTPRSRKSKPRSPNGRQARHRWLRWLSHIHVPIGWMLIIIEIAWLLFYPPDSKFNPPDLIHDQISAPLLVLQG